MHELSWLGRLAALVAAVGGSAAAAPAHALTIELDWSAPRGCISAEQLEAELQQRIRGAQPAADIGELEVNGQLEEAEGGYRMELRASAGELSSERELSAATCEELGEAAILIVTLLADMAAAEAARAVTVEAAEPAESEDLVARWFARVGLISDLGSLPGIAFGPGLAFGLELSDLRVELGGSYLLPQQVMVAGRARPVAELQVFSGSLGTCYGFLPRAVYACLRGEYGRIGGESQNVSDTSSGGAAWWLGLVGIRAEFALTGALSLGAELALGVPFDRIRFEIDGLGTVHELPAVIGRLVTALEWRF